MQEPQNRQELESFFDKEDFIIKTVQQITKDLVGLEGAEVDFNIILEQDVLLQLNVQLAAVLLEMSSRNLQQFIYRVDLKESEYLQAVSKEDDFQELAFRIIRREAQKVYLRAKFS